jgi:hypothetical protein
MGRMLSAAFVPLNGHPFLCCVEKLPEERVLRALQGCRRSASAIVWSPLNEYGLVRRKPIFELRPRRGT